VARKKLLTFAVVVSHVLLASLLLAASDINPRVEPIVRALENHYHDVKTLKAIFLERYSDGPQHSAGIRHCLLQPAWPDALGV
jgi:hypothetical protein